MNLIYVLINEFENIERFYQMIEQMEDFQ